MQRCGPRTKLAARISSEVFYRHLPQVNFGDCHRLPVSCRLGLRVHPVNKDARPLISDTVGIYRSSRLASGLDLYSLRSCFDGVFAVDSLDYEVRVSIGGTPGHVVECSPP